MLRPLVSLLLLALVLAGCSGLAGTGDVEYIAGEGTVVQVPIDERESPVTLEGDELEGDQIDTADWRGEVVVVNFWGSWCGPCRAEAPRLVEADDETDARFVGVNIRDDTDAALAFERSYDVEYPSIDDPGSELALPFGARYAPSATPTTYVLDRRHRVAAIISGPLPSAGTLIDLVDEVSAEDG